MKALAAVLFVVIASIWFLALLQRYLGKPLRKSTFEEILFVMPRTIGFSCLGALATAVAFAVLGLIFGFSGLLSLQFVVDVPKLLRAASSLPW